jgi:hypothetical protein
VAKVVTAFQFERGESRIAVKAFSVSVKSECEGSDGVEKASRKRLSGLVDLETI